MDIKETPTNPEPTVLEAVFEAIKGLTVKEARFVLQEAIECLDINSTVKWIPDET